jgi:uncharacterized protein YgbK (DUF1537 family)
MSSVLFAAVADDDTGATDLAGMLRDRGVRTIVVFAGYTLEQLAAWSADAHALILGIASRSTGRQAAFDRTRYAIELFKPLNPRVFFVKSIAEASSDLRLLTGTSALGTVLPDVWARKGWWVQTKRYLADSAFDALLAGDEDRHDQLVRATVEWAMDENDIVVLAPGSMPRLVPMAQGHSLMPALFSPRLGIEALRERLSP